MHVVHHWSRHLTGRDNLLVSVAGRGLSAPLIERLLELPMDISSGTVDGEIIIAANDDATWEFPAITGKLTCRGEWHRYQPGHASYYSSKVLLPPSSGLRKHCWQQLQC